jgi:hypothetical protein
LFVPITNLTSGHNEKLRNYTMNLNIDLSEAFLPVWSFKYPPKARWFAFYISNEGG